MDTDKYVCINYMYKHLIKTWRHKSTVHVHVHLCLCYRNTHVQVSSESCEPLHLLVYMYMALK